MMEYNVNELENIVKKRLENTSHDYNHIERVRGLSKKIASKMDVRLDYVDILALIHDLFDHKYFNGDTKKELGILLAPLKLPYADELINDVLNFGFSTNSSNLSLEAKIVSDSDRLDSIGAIGIARCFSYSGETNRPLYDLNIPLVGLSREEYKEKGSQTALNHFYDKLFKIKDSLFTEEALKIAISREKFMKEYIDECLSEIKGDC